MAEGLSPYIRCEHRADQAQMHFEVCLAKCKRAKKCRAYQAHLDKRIEEFDKNLKENEK